MTTREIIRDGADRAFLHKGIGHFSFADHTSYLKFLDATKEDPAGALLAMERVGRHLREDELSKRIWLKKLPFWRRVLHTVRGWFVTDPINYSAEVFESSFEEACEKLDTLPVAEVYGHQTLIKIAKARAKKVQENIKK